MLSIRLDHAIEHQLNQLAQQKQTSKSKIIKEALTYYFDLMKQESHSKTPYELGTELFGQYGSQDGTLSATYKTKLKAKLHAKSAH